MMRRLMPPLLLLAIAFFSPSIARTETSQELRAIGDDVRTLKEGQTEVRKDVQEIKSLLGMQDARPETNFEEAVIEIKGAPFKGNGDARIVMILLADYRCLWCGRYIRDTFPQVEKEYLKTGKIKYVFFDFPLNTTTFKVAEAANCAREQDKFWEMHDRLFANPNALDPNDLAGHAAAIGLDVPVFRQCLETGRYSARVGEELGIGRNLGVNGTPTFLFGFAEPGSKVRVVKMLKGGRYDALKDALDSLLSSQVK